MTCIVGFVDKKNKKVIIGADSAGSNDSEVLIRKDPKIFKNGEFIKRSVKPIHCFGGCN